MILSSCSAGTVGVTWMPRPRLACFASNVNVNAEQLRSQLDHLLSEAESTRAKANNVRSRLLRLSEVAENLRRQAALNVQKGKENEARELLVQKKKVMQALEKSKSRIEWLDELSAKLNEAISLKESQLLRHVSLDLKDENEHASSAVRIISPRQEVGEDIIEDGVEPNFSDHSAKQDMQLFGDREEIMTVENESENLPGHPSISSWRKDDIASSLEEISSYEAFLEHLDLQLSKIEAKLVTVLKISTFLLEGEDEPKNSKVQQVSELLESICGIRQRINSMKEGNAEKR